MCVMKAVAIASVNQISPVDYAILARMVSTDIPIVHTVAVMSFAHWRFVTRTRAPDCVPCITLLLSGELWRRLFGR